MLRFFAPLFFSFSIAFADSVYCLRAPRSGSHFMFYCLNEIFDINIVSSKADRRFQHPFFPKKGGPNLYVAHNAANLQLDKESFDSDYLICLVRNYRENYIRRYETLPRILKQLRFEARWRSKESPHFNLEKLSEFNQDHYFHCLRCYDLWDPDKRILIYYEDLIERPKMVMEELAQFFQMDNYEEILDQFMRDLPDHKERSLALYNHNYESKTQTDGKDLSSHSKRLGSKAAASIDFAVMTLFPDYFDRYLLRFKRPTPPSQ